MKSRRQFLKSAIGLLTGAGLVFHPIFQGVRLVYVEAKKILLPKGTPRETLIDKNPAALDLIGSSMSAR